MLGILPISKIRKYEIKANPEHREEEAVCYADPDL
jgi:hypothetical protein